MPGMQSQAIWMVRPPLKRVQKRPLIMTKAPNGWTKTSPIWCCSSLNLWRLMHLASPQPMIIAKGIHCNGRWWVLQMGLNGAICTFNSWTMKRQRSDWLKVIASVYSQGSGLLGFGPTIPTPDGCGWCTVWRWPLEMELWLSPTLFAALLIVKLRLMEVLSSHGLLRNRVPGNGMNFVPRSRFGSACSATARKRSARSGSCKSAQASLPKLLLSGFSLAKWGGVGANPWVKDS